MKRRSVLLLIAVLFTSAGIVSAVRVSRPSDGAGTNPSLSPWRADGVVIDSVLVNGTALRKGDVLIAVNGQSVATRSVPRSQLGDHLVYQVRRNGRLMDVPVTMVPYPLSRALASNWPTLTWVTSTLLVALYIFGRRPHDRAARALLVLAVLTICGATSWVFPPEVADVSGGPGWWIYLGGSLCYALTWASATHFALVFPKPGPLLRCRPWSLGAVYGLPFVLYAAYLTVTLPRASSPIHSAGFIGSPAVVAEYLFPPLVAAIFVRTYWTSRDETSRQQVLWVVAAFTAGAIAYIVLWPLPSLIMDHPLLPWSLSPLAFVFSPLAFAVAILRHQLFDIEVIVRRSLLYAALTLCLLGIYTVTVALLSGLLQPPESSLAATGVVAILFAPLRQHFQHGVSRLLYGERDHPEAVISNLSRRLEEAPLPEQVLPQVVETVAEALRLPFVGIDLLHPGGRQPAARYGELAGAPLSLPLTYQGGPIGWMLVGERVPGEPFGKKDRRLLEDLARHVGATAYAVRVTAELQRSREGLVRAREEERRRLRRDLHDGLGPTLAAGVLQLQVALGLIRTDPGAAEKIISGIASNAKELVEDIRRLVEALRPPALDQLGLVCALEERASHFGPVRRDEGHPGTLRVKVEADGELTGLPAAVEVAAYHIVCEALNNASRHGRATTCSVRLAVQDRALNVEVMDDGCGLEAHRRHGVGLTSMRERAAELGGRCTILSGPVGGTVVHARLPVPEP